MGKKKIEISFSIAALIFIIAAAISFLNNNSPLGVVFLCVSSTLIIIGGVYSHKDQHTDSDSTSNEKKK